jgi:hypothetical protein
MPREWHCCAVPAKIDRDQARRASTDHVANRSAKRTPNCRHCLAQASVIAALATLFPLG